MASPAALVGCAAVGPLPVGGTAGREISLGVTALEGGAQRQENGDLELSDTESADELACRRSALSRSSVSRKLKKNAESSKSVCRKGSGSSVASRKSVEGRRPCRSLSGVSSDGSVRLRSSLTNSTAADTRQNSLSSHSHVESVSRRQKQNLRCLGQPSKAQWEALPIATRSAIASQLRTQHQLLQQRVESSDPEKPPRRNALSLSAVYSRKASPLHTAPPKQKPTRGSCRLEVQASRCNGAVQTRSGDGALNSRGAVRRSASATSGNCKTKDGALCPHGLRYRSLCFFCSSPDPQREAASSGGSRLLRGTVASRSRRSATLSPEKTSTHKTAPALGVGRRKEAGPQGTGGRLHVKSTATRRRPETELLVFDRLWGDAMLKQSQQTRRAQREGSVGPWGARLESLGTALWVSGLRKSDSQQNQQNQNQHSSAYHRAEDLRGTLTPARTARAKAPPSLWNAPDGRNGGSTRDELKKDAEETKRSGEETSDGSFDAIPSESVSGVSADTRGLEELGGVWTEAESSGADALPLASNNSSTPLSQSSALPGKWLRLNGRRSVFTPRSRTPPRTAGPIVRKPVSAVSAEASGKGLVQKSKDEKPTFAQQQLDDARVNAASGWVEQSAVSMAPPLPSVDGGSRGEGIFSRDFSKEIKRSVRDGLSRSAPLSNMVASVNGNAELFANSTVRPLASADGAGRQLPSPFGIYVRPATLKSAAGTLAPSASLFMPGVHTPVQRSMEASPVSPQSVPYASAAPFWGGQGMQTGVSANFLPMKGNGAWMHFTSSAAYPSQQQLQAPVKPLSSAVFRPAPPSSFSKSGNVQFSGAREDESRRTSSTAASPVRQFSGSSMDGNVTFLTYLPRNSQALHLQTRPLLQHHPVYTPQGFSTANGM